MGLGGRQHSLDNTTTEEDIMVGRHKGGGMGGNTRFPQKMGRTGDAGFRRREKGRGRRCIRGGREARNRKASCADII